VSPGISVALATYNGERFLREQLESIARQEVLPAELVACDDGSTDATVEVLEAFSRVAPFPVRVYSNERTLGYGDNFLKTATLCAGDWVAFCDQDDVWLPGKLRAVGEALAHAPEAVLITHSATQTDEHLRPLASRLPDYRRTRVVAPLQGRPLRPVPGFSCVFRRDLCTGVVFENRPPDLVHPERRQAHDQLVPLLANAMGAVVYIANSLALYRRHGETQTGAPGSGVYAEGVRHRLNVAWQAHACDYGHYARVAEHSAAFLAGTASRVEGTRALRLRAAAAYYARYGAAFRTRAALYEGPLRQRWRAWGSLLRARSYASIGGGKGLGYKALAKDFVAMHRA